MPNQASVAGGPTMLAIMLLYAFFYLPIPTLLLSFLQVYLCRRNLRRGLILPIVSAVFGVLAALAVGLLIGLNSLPTLGPVSYTHPDVYKRQGIWWPHHSCREMHQSWTFSIQLV